MSCCGPSRRNLLAAIGLATLLPVTGTIRSSSARAQPNSLVATDLEVVTITDRSVILTWTTVTPDPGEGWCLRTPTPKSASAPPTQHAP